MKNLEYYLTQHLRLNGVYWAITTLDLLDRLNSLPKDEIIDYTLSCQSSDGGFGGHTGHESHMLYTLSAVQILCTYDALDRIDTEAVVECMSKLLKIDHPYA